MIRIDIPGFGDLRLEHLVLDYNGTIALDGRLLPGVGPSTVCVGNGRNDRRMLELGALGIAVLQSEGAAAEALGAADVVMASVVDALEAPAHPLRLVASLRS